MFYSVPFPLRMNELDLTYTKGGPRRFTLEDKGEFYEGSYPVPGASREDIEVTVKDNGMALQVSYEPKQKNPFVGTFKYAWSTKGFDTDNIKAACNNGVFTLTVPKLKKPEPKVKTIKVD